MSVLVLAALLGGCGRQPERVRTGTDARTTAAVERVRAPLAAQLDAARADLATRTAERDGRIAALTAEVDRLRASRKAPSTASRSGRRLSGVSGSCGQWTVLLSQYPWPVGEASSVMRCESRCNPSARNPSGANGLMQVMHGPMDPAANIAAAYRLYASRGWQPWVCKP